MSYSEAYKKCSILFGHWLDTIMHIHGKRQKNMIDEFFIDMKLAWSYIPGLEHYGNDDQYCTLMTDEELEMIFKYFHDNPEKWKEFLEYGY